MALGTDGLITVVGDVDTITDTAASGTLTVELSDKLVVGSKVYLPIERQVTLNEADGTFAIKLPPTGTSGVTYRFTLVAYALVNGQREHYTETTDATLDATDADAQGVIQYKDLSPVASPGVPQTFLTKTAAQSLITAALTNVTIDTSAFVLKGDLEAVDAVTPAELQAAIAGIAVGDVDLTEVNASIAAADEKATGAVSAASAAAAAVAGKADVASTLGVTVLPSGDTTGVADVASINAALLAGDVTLRGTYYTLGAIKMPSDRTLTLFNAEVRRVNDKGTGSTTTNCNIVTNLNMDAAGNQNVVVRGIGKASFRLHSATAGYVRNTGTISAYFGFYWVNVTGLTVQDVSIGPTRAFTSNIQVCKNVAYRNVRCNQDRLAENQDGLDIGPGCYNVVFDGITGVTSDDGFSIYAQNTSGSLHPYTTSLTAAQRNVTDIDIRNVQMDVGINVFRFQAGDGSQLKRVTASNITNLRAASIGVNGDTAAVLQFGSTNYVNANPATSDLSDFALTGYKGRSTWLIGADSNFSSVRVSAVNLQDAESLVGYRALKNKGDGATYIPQFNNVTIDGVVLANAGATEPTLVRLPVTQAVDNINIRNVTADTLKWLTRNGAAVTNLALTNIKVASITGAAFGSTVAETGSATNVEVGLAASATGVYRGSVMRLALRNCPFARAADTVPAPIVGSQVTFAAGLDPSGGGSPAAGVYVADGIAWNRLLSLANDPAASTAPAPVTPTNLALSGTPTATSATFTFDTVANATSYPYRVRTVGATTWMDRTGPTSSPFTATSLTAGQNYEVQIAASGVGGTSAYTTSVTFSTAAAAAAGPVAFTDGFTTASTSGLPGWTPQAGAAETGVVDANGAGTSRSSGGAVTLWWKNATQPNTANQYGEVTIGALGATSKFAPLIGLRSAFDSATNAATQYFARYLDGTGVVLFKVVNGAAATTLGTYPVALSAGGKLRLRVTTPATGTARLEVSTDGGATWAYSVDDTTNPITSGAVLLGVRWTAAADANTRARAFALGDVTA